MVVVAGVIYISMPFSIVQGKNMTLTQSKRIRHSGGTMALAVLLATLVGGCGKASTGESTADRVKRVEERQKTDANFHVERAPAKAALPPVAAKPAAVAAGQADATIR